MATDDFQATTAAFSAWLSDNGIKTSPKMAITDFRAKGRGRGVVAISDFEEDEIVFTIPRSAILSFKNTASGSSNALSSLSDSETPSWLALTAAMIAESGLHSSKWAPYFAILPRQLDSLVFWSDSELAELQASAVTKKIGKSTADVGFSTHIAPLGLANCSMDLCHQVASTIMAYAFDIPDISESEAPKGPRTDDGDGLESDDEEDERTVLSMIPLADLLNANADLNNARLVCDDEDVLEMRTIKPIAKGEEILNDYGQLPRSDLLRRYGYVTERYSVYDVAEISTEWIIAVFKSDKFHRTLATLSEADLERRIELCDREGILEDEYDITHHSSEDPSIPDELLALLYVLLLEDTHLDALLKSEAALPSRSKLSTQLVGEILTILLQARESQYATTLEEDQRLLLAGGLARRKEMAIQVRSGEKEVLRAAINSVSLFSGSNQRMRISGQLEAPLTSAGKRKADESSHQSKKGRFS